MPRKFFGETGWKALQARTGLGYDPATNTVVCSDDTWHSFVKVFKECNHLRYEGLRNKELYYNVFKKNHAVGALAFGSVMMGGGNTPSFDFDFSMDQSGTHPVFEEEMSSSIGTRRQANTKGMPDEAGPSCSRGSAGKRKQRDATDEMTFSAITIMWHYFDAHPRLQRPFCQLDDDDRRGIIASVVTSQMPPPN
ncbi:hypothetical protein TIFTF001_036040 [Ficus carica]|uniref:Myb/SANT-like domain-containing protein n=1 Tax=Ficus carica TaxID=3494 RepID=A0AA88EBX2_FICCA|nr:hypothetical protein TIFTF001_036040 [Ficus carica]